MILDGDHQRAWKDGETRDSRARLHRPRIARAGDPRRLRKLYHHVMKEFDPGRQRRLHRVGHRPGAPARDRHARHLGAFPRRHRRLRRRRGERLRWCSRRRRSLAGRRPRRRHSVRRHPTASASSSAATTASVVALDAKGEVTVLATDAKRRWIDNVALHPDGAVAWSAGKTAFVRSGKGEDKHVRCAVDRRRAGLRAEGAAARDRALQRRDAVVSQHGGRSRKFWNGPARISASSSAPTTSSWSPRCTSRRCMAGGSPIPGTCG